MKSKRIVGILLVIVVVVLCAVSLTACLSAIGLGLLSALLGTNSTDLADATIFKSLKAEIFLKKLMKMMVFTSIPNS